MKKETDIIEMIKTRRYLKQALRKLLTLKQRMRLKERSRYICVDPKAQETDAGENVQELKLLKLSNLMQPKKRNDDHLVLTDGFYSVSESDGDNSDSPEPKP